MKFAVPVNMKVDQVLNRMVSVGPATTDFRKKLMENRAIFPLVGKERGLSRKARTDFMEIHAAACYLHSLRDLTPASFCQSELDMELNTASSRDGLPVAGSIHSPTYAELRDAALAFMNPFRFGDKGLVNYYLRIDEGWAPLDCYVSTVIEAFSMMGRVLKEYANVLSQEGTSRSAREFISYCEKNFSPLLDNGRRWSSGLELVNSIADALDGTESSLASVELLEPVTARVRGNLGGVRPFLTKRDSYVDDFEKDWFPKDSQATVH